MRILVLYYSHSGNNRRFARRLARRIGADAEEVVPKGWRTFLSVMRDMSKDRRPRIRPLRSDPRDYDHTILVGPVWDMRVARPLVTAIEVLRDRIGPYSFASLCGDVRDGQPEALRAELTNLVGHAPQRVTELFVGELLPERQRRNVLKVSGHKVTERDLDRYHARIEAIAADFRA